MKKVLCVILFVMITAPIFAVSCGESAGPVTTRQFDYTGFTGVQAGSAFQVDISPSDTYIISITAPQNWFDHIKVEKSGNTLVVNLTWGFWDFWHRWNSKPELKITMPELDNLDISGASTCNAKGFKSTGDFNVNLSGASTANIDMKAFDASVTISGASHLNGTLNINDMRLNLSGASRTNLGGSMSSLNLNCSGASNADVRDLPAKDSRIELSGASRATITVSGTMDVFLSGASNLDYYGSPDIRKLDITGASHIQPKQ